MLRLLQQITCQILGISKLAAPPLTGLAFEKRHLFYRSTQFSFSIILTHEDVSIYTQNLLWIAGSSLPHPRSYATRLGFKGRGDLEYTKFWIVHLDSVFANHVSQKANAFSSKLTHFETFSLSICEATNSATRSMCSTSSLLFVKNMAPFFR